MVKLVKCACGFEGTPEAFAYVGVQDLMGDGEHAALANCPKCRSTVAVAVWTDWSTCWACGEPILGDASDPKIAVGPGCVMHRECERGSVRRRKSKPDASELAPTGSFIPHASVRAACEVPW